MNNNKLIPIGAIRRLTCSWLPTGDARTPLTCVWAEPGTDRRDAFCELVLVPLVFLGLILLLIRLMSHSAFGQAGSGRIVVR